MSFITTQHSHPLCWWRGVFQSYEQDDLQRLQIGKDKWPTLFSLSAAHLLQHSIGFLLHARLLGLKTDIASAKNILASNLNAFLTSKYGLISSKVLVREASSTKGAMVITRSIMASLRENLSKSAEQNLKECIHRHVLPCELCGLRATESFYGFLHERAHHLWKCIIYVREKRGMFCFPNVVSSRWKKTHLSLSDIQVNLDGVQYRHPVGARLSRWRLLPVDVKEDGQEVLGEVAQLGLFLL